MPYTPPSQQSPLASRPDTPLNRSSSYSRYHVQSDGASDSLTKPSLPRSNSSVSYLSRHRRTPSITKASNSNADSSASKDTLGANSGTEPVDAKGERKATPNGTANSPPDSSQTSSDDESLPRKRRGRELENLAELQAAIRIIQQHRESSPTGSGEEVRRARMALDLVVPQLESARNGFESSLSGRASEPLSKEARKISHSRSSTEDSILRDVAGKTTESPTRISDGSEVDDVEDDELRIKPPLLRKKSGELVKPAIRPSSAKRRPSSMPGTPTYSKAVHFDNHLEHVRHFLQVEKPAAVSAGSSPVESYESEHEFPFGSPDDSRSRSPPFEWEMRITNFPRETLERKTKPVRVERVSLSSDSKNLVGTIAVANISFHKLVVARFTFDYWKTTSEVVAEYNNDVRRKELTDGYDRFTFCIKLADQANLGKKTLFFCVRYNVNGREYWDNNENINFQVDFTKKARPQNEKSVMQGAGSRSTALPRSRPTSSTRPHSMPISFDDFAHGLDPQLDFSAYRQPAAMLLGESPPSKIRFKTSKPANEESTIETPAIRSSTPVGQAFGNRYSFGASLSAAIQTANTASGDRSGLKAKADPKSHPTHSAGDASDKSRGLSDVLKPSQGALTDTTRPGSLTSTSLQSSSYNELLDKYCFYGSAKPSPRAADVTLKQTDGAADDTPILQNELSNHTVSDVLDEPSLDERADATQSPKQVPQNNTVQVPHPTSPGTMTGSALGSRTSSPVSFGYPYLQNINTGFDAPTPTAIRG